MRNRILGIAGTFILPIMLFIMFTVLTPGFGINSLTIVISQSMIPTAIGFGMCLLFQCGLMDFSIGCRVIFAAVTGAVLSQIWGLAGFLVGCIAGSVAAALVVAFLYKYLKIPSMVISLGFVLIGETISYKTGELIGAPASIAIAKEISAWFVFPWNILWVIGSGLILFVIVYRTKIGFHIQAVGSDELLAMSIGIVPGVVKTSAYLLSSIFVVIGAFLQISYAGRLGIQLGAATMGMVFKPMMGVMVGMTLLRLWNNLPVLILLGEICIAIIFNGLIAAGLQDFYQSIVLGVILLVILGISGNIDNFKEAIRRRRVRKLGPEGL